MVTWQSISSIRTTLGLAISSSCSAVAPLRMARRMVVCSKLTKGTAPQAYASSTRASASLSPSSTAEIITFSPGWIFKLWHITVEAIFLNLGSIIFLLPFLLYL